MWAKLKRTPFCLWPSLIGDFWKRDYLESCPGSVLWCLVKTLAFQEHSLPIGSCPDVISHHLAYAPHSELTAPWPAGATERVWLRAHDPLSLFLLRILLLQDVSLSPVIFCLVAAIALSVLASLCLFLLGLNGRRPSEWLESYSKWSKRRISWAWGWDL